MRCLPPPERALTDGFEAENRADLIKLTVSMIVLYDTVYVMRILML